MCVKGGSKNCPEMVSREALNKTIGYGEDPNCGKVGGLGGCGIDDVESDTSTDDAAPCSMVNQNAALRNVKNMINAFALVEKTAVGSLGSSGGGIEALRERPGELSRARESSGGAVWGSKDSPLRHPAFFENSEDESRAQADAREKKRKITR